MLSQLLHRSLRCVEAFCAGLTQWVSIRLLHRCTRHWMAVRQQISVSLSSSTRESTLWPFGSGPSCLSFWKGWRSCMRWWSSLPPRRFMQSSCSTSWTPSGMPDICVGNECICVDVGVCLCFVIEWNTGVSWSLYIEQCAQHALVV